MKKIFSNKRELIPAIIQEEKTGEVLMLGYMNQKSFQMTLDSGFVTLFSRTRNKLWVKGETSGNRLIFEKIYIDCDSDAILIKAVMLGSKICHTDNISCFYRRVI